MDNKLQDFLRTIGKTQRATILSLSDDWGRAADHQAAKRLWYRTPRLVDHKHCEDNCWALTDAGIEAKRILQEQEAAR